MADSICPICQDSLAEGGTITSCKHVFCMECIHTWLLEHTDCPMCRRVLIKPQQEEIQRRSIILEQFREEYDHLEDASIIEHRERSDSEDELSIVVRGALVLYVIVFAPTAFLWPMS
jgi:hypothetical protein